jgi:hypothetical protein
VVSWEGWITWLSRTIRQATKRASKQEFPKDPSALECFRKGPMSIRLNEISWSEWTAYTSRRNIWPAEEVDRGKLRVWLEPSWRLWSPVGEWQKAITAQRKIVLHQCASSLGTDLWSLSLHGHSRWILRGPQSAGLWLWLRSRVLYSPRNTGAHNEPSSGLNAYEVTRSSPYINTSVEVKNIWS